MATDYFFLFIETDQFHCGGYIVSADRIEHAGKPGLIDPQPITVFLARCRFSGTDGSNRRVTENDGWNQFVIEVTLSLTVIEPVGETSAGSNRNGGQGCTTGDIAKCKNIALVRALVQV